LISNSHSGSTIMGHVSFCWYDHGPLRGLKSTVTTLRLNLPPSNTNTCFQGTESLTIKAHAVRQSNNASEVRSVPSWISRRPSGNVQHGRNDGRNIAFLKVREYGRYCNSPTGLALVRSTASKPYSRVILVRPGMKRQSLAEVPVRKGVRVEVDQKVVRYLFLVLHLV
jgi:hypothetical protein